jgi:hypothetical protein
MATQPNKTLLPPRSDESSGITAISGPARVSNPAFPEKRKRDETESLTAANRAKVHHEREDIDSDIEEVTPSCTQLDTRRTIGPSRGTISASNMAELVSFRETWLAQLNEMRKRGETESSAAPKRAKVHHEREDSDSDVEEVTPSCTRLATRRTMEPSIKTIFASNMADLELFRENWIAEFTNKKKIRATPLAMISSLIHPDHLSKPFLDGLPFDIYVLIAEDLTYRDLRNLRLTSKTLYENIEWLEQRRRADLTAARVQQFIRRGFGGLPTELSWLIKAFL